MSGVEVTRLGKWQAVLAMINGIDGLWPEAANGGAAARGQLSAPQPFGTAAGDRRRRSSIATNCLRANARSQRTWRRHHAKVESIL